jgi:hypothetical protein
MANGSPGIRRLCVAVGAAEPLVLSGGERAALERRVSLLLDDLCVAPDLEQLQLFRQPASVARTGEVILLPVGIDEPMVVTLVIGWLQEALRRVNAERPGDRPRAIRLRMAVDEGLTFVAERQFGGPAVAKAGRLLAASALRTALAANPGSDMAVLLSDQVVAGLSDFGRHLPAGELTRVEIAGSAGPWPDVAWLLVPRQR